MRNNEVYYRWGSEMVGSLYLRKRCNTALKAVTWTLLISFVGSFTIPGAVADEPVALVAGTPSYYLQELDVSDTGSELTGPIGDARYTFPMGDIAATYSSARGWSIGQTSAIRRSTKWGTPSYTTDDIFTLNGGEMVRDSSVFQGRYYTARQNYARIEYFAEGTGASYWKVTAQDGTVSLYGNTADSRFERNGKSYDVHPRAWALNEIRSEKDRTLVRYVYDENNTKGSAYLSKVVKGKIGADSSCGYTATRIYYEDRIHIRTSFREGTKAVDHRRPKWVIQVVGCSDSGTGGQVMSAYRIDWMNTPQTKAETIAAIVPFGSDTQDDNGVITQGSGLPPTTFSYAVMGGDFGEYDSWGDVAATAIRRSFGGKTLNDMVDMNGDALPDSIDVDHNGYLKVNFNNGDSFDSPAIDYGQPGSVRWTSQLMALQDLIDMDGDGLPDILSRNGDWSGPINIQLNQGSGWDAIQSWRNSVGVPIRYETSSYVSPYFTDVRTVMDLVDMNGDGLPDVVQNNGDGYIYVKLNDEGGFHSTPIWTQNGPFDYLGYTRLFGSWGEIYQTLRDMNGDGLTDIFMRDKSSHEYSVYYNNGAGFEDSEPWPAPSGKETYLFQNFHNGNQGPWVDVSVGCYFSWKSQFPGFDRYERRWLA